MKTRVHSLSVSRTAASLVAFCGLLVGADALHGADIAWREIVIDTTDSDTDPGGGLGDAAVSTAGTLVEAANFGIAADVVVNGVNFVGVDFSGSNPTNLNIGYDSNDNIGSFGNGGTTTGGAIDELTGSFGRDANVSFHAAELTGLSVGQQYLVQFISSFARLNRTTTFDDGNGNSTVQLTNDPHSASTGVFTADATTQAVNMTISAGSQFLSGYQLRAIPEPGSLVLLSWSGLAAVFRRRRR